MKHQNIVQYYGSEIVRTSFIPSYTNYLNISFRKILMDKVLLSVQMEDRFCIYLEYVHPGSINKFVRDHGGAMTESIVRNFTRHIVSGLTYLHSTKTIHR